MKKRNIITIGLLICISIFCACRTYTVNIIKKSPEKISKVALISTYIGPFEVVASTSMYSGIMAGKIQSISNDINTMFKNYVNNYRDAVGQSIKKNCNCDVLYGDALYSKPEYVALKEKFDKPQSLKIKEMLGDKANDNDSYFPEAYIAKNDINLVKKFPDPSTFKWGFSKSTESVYVDYFTEMGVKAEIAEICKTLNVDYVVIDYSFLTNLYGDLLTQGQVWLHTLFFLYDKNGDCIANGYNTGNGSAKGTSLNAANIEQYPDEMNKFSFYINPIITDIINGNN